MSGPELIASIAAVVAGTGIAYTYAGYALLLAILASLKKRQVKKADWKGTISIVLVARNAEVFIKRKLENLLAQKGSWKNLEIIVASDGSSDGTADYVRNFADTGVKLIESDQHRGKAAVLNDVVPQCKGEIVVLADVRQRFEESTVAELCANFADPEIGAVSGELLFEKDGKQGLGGGFSAYWNIEKFVRKAESRTGSVIGCTGAVYAIRKECFVPMNPDTVLDDVAVPMSIAISGKRVVFDPDARAWDKAEQHASREAARKVRTLAGNIQLCSLYPQLLNPFKNKLFIQFVSHKLMRLFAPWLLAIFLAATLYLSSLCAFASMLALLQLVFYSLAVSGTALKSPRLTLIKLPATFLLLNVWAAIAPFHYWRGKLSPKWK